MEPFKPSAPPAFAVVASVLVSGATRNPNVARVAVPAVLTLFHVPTLDYCGEPRRHQEMALAHYVLVSLKIL